MTHDFFKTKNARKVLVLISAHIARLFFSFSFSNSQELQNFVNHLNEVCITFVRALVKFQIKYTVFLCKLNLFSFFSIIFVKNFLEIHINCILKVFILKYCCNLRVIYPVHPVLSQIWYGQKLRNIGVNALCLKFCLCNKNAILQLGNKL